jgi:hypothetical protein
LFTLEFGWYILHFVPGENCMSYFWSSIGRLAVVLKYAFSCLKGYPLGPVTLVCGTAIGIVFHYSHCWSFIFCRVSPMSSSLSWSLLRAAGYQLSAAVAAAAHTFLMSVSASTFW